MKEHLRIRGWKQIHKLYGLCAILSLSFLLLNSCLSEVKNASDPQPRNKDTSSVTPTDASVATPTNTSIYSVMYRVWERDECTTQMNGSVIDVLFKEGRSNGFVCVSQNPDYIGKKDTIGINFYAENLERCQQIVASYWTGAPSNRYSWYPNPSSSEQNRFKMGNNTCSVEYPNR